MKQQSDSDSQQFVPYDANLNPILPSFDFQTFEKFQKMIDYLPNKESHLIYYDIQNKQKHVLDALKMFKSIFNEREEWNLSGNKWARLKLKKVFENLSAAYPTKIDLCQNNEPQMLNSLSCVRSFPCLKELRLCKKLTKKANNRIRSFERLTFIDFPVLEDLNLTDNDVIYINCLNKINFRPQNIRKVSFYANRVQSIETISRVAFVNTGLKRKLQEQEAKKKSPLATLFEQEQQREAIQKSEEEKEHEILESDLQAPLPQLSLIFGINQIGQIQKINKLQRQQLAPQKIVQKKRMSFYWQKEGVKKVKKHPHKKPIINHGNNRRLMFSIEMNRYESYNPEMYTTSTTNSITGTTCPQITLVFEGLWKERHYWSIVRLHKLYKVLQSISELQYFSGANKKFIKQISQNYHILCRLLS